jgi:hypothetical protein
MFGVRRVWIMWLLRQLTRPRMRPKAGASFGVDRRAEGFTRGLRNKSNINHESAREPTAATKRQHNNVNVY